MKHNITFKLFKNENLKALPKTRYQKKLSFLKIESFLFLYKEKDMTERFKVSNVNDLELIYSILRDTYPGKEIKIQFNWNTKEYTIEVTNKTYCFDPEVPVDLDIQVVYGDTDSIFVKFKYNRDDFEKNRSDTFRLATVCGDNLTNDIFNRKPIELEFEKVFHPFILLTKKRYIANKFENTKDPFDLKGVDAKGIALTRRDYCPMVKKCYKKVIDTILADTNKEKLENQIDEYIKKEIVEKMRNGATYAKIFEPLIFMYNYMEHNAKIVKYRAQVTL